MKSNRRQFLHTLGAGLTLNANSSIAETRPPNLVLLLADQHRGCDLHCAGNQILLTPNLDQLAREGMRFDNAIANCPVCTPSRATLLTGKYPLAHRCISNDLPLPADRETIASVLSRRGYKTGYIGKWHLDGIPRSKFTPPGPRRMGFNDFWAAYNCHHDYLNPKYYLDNSDLIEGYGYEPDIQTNLAIDFLRSASSSPFFLMVSYGPPHDPYDRVPLHYKGFYDPEKIPLPSNCIQPNPKAIAGYYAHITALDVCIGKLLRSLDDLGLQENTLIVYTSDHGDMLWSHGRINKQQPWEEAIRVPLIMRLPRRIPRNRNTDLLLGTADLAPTLLSITGSEIPAEMQGRNLSQQIEYGEGTKPGSTPIFDILPCDQAKQWNGKPWRGVRSERYTYARWIDRGWILFDNQKDPLQMNNLIDHPNYKNLQKQMEDELQKWLLAMNDAFLPEDELLERMNMTQAWKERNVHFQSGNKW